MTILTCERQCVIKLVSTAQTNKRLSSDVPISNQCLVILNLVGLDYTRTCLRRDFVQLSN